MKRSQNFLVIVFVLFVGLLTVSCSGSSNPLQTSVSTAVSSDCAGVPTPSVDVDALISEKLQNHHGIEEIYSAQHTREEWNTTLDRMIGFGANINDTEKQEIIDYLVCFHP